MHAVAGPNYMPAPMRQVLPQKRAKPGLTFWMRCCAHEYRMAAAGNCNKLNPWDHAAGWLLHQEAGGYSAHLDGRPYRAGNLDGGLTCAPDHEA